MYHLLNTIFMISGTITLISFVVMTITFIIGIILTLTSIYDYDWVPCIMLIALAVAVIGLVVALVANDRLPKYTEGDVQVTNQLTDKMTSYQDVHDFKQLTNDSDENDAGIYRMVDEQGKTIKVYVSPKETIKQVDEHEYKGEN